MKAPVRRSPRIATKEAKEREFKPYQNLVRSSNINTLIEQQISMCMVELRQAPCADAAFRRRFSCWVAPLLRSIVRPEADFDKISIENLSYLWSIMKIWSDDICDGYVEYTMLSTRFYYDWKYVSQLMLAKGWHCVNPPMIRYE